MPETLRTRWRQKGILAQLPSSVLPIIVTPLRCALPASADFVPVARAAPGLLRLSRGWASQLRWLKTGTRSYRETLAVARDMQPLHAFDARGNTMAFLHNITALCSSSEQLHMSHRLRWHRIVRQRSFPCPTWSGCLRIWTSRARGGEGTGEVG